jgi:hypothetical protein
MTDARHFAQNTAAKRAQQIATAAANDRDIESRTAAACFCNSARLFDVLVSARRVAYDVGHVLGGVGE